MGRTGRAYRRVRATLTDKPTFFGWVRDSRLAASGRPYSKGQVDWLRSQGISAILTLTEDPLPAGWTRGIEAHHLPLGDHAPPTPAQMRLGADYIASALSGGKVMLVHCLAGKGRTGCVLAAYLMVYEGKTARAAIDELRSLRDGSVEHQQERSVLDFEGDALTGRQRAQSLGTTPRT